MTEETNNIPAQSLISAEPQPAGKTEATAPKTPSEAWRAFKFVLFSISAGVIQIASFTALNELTNLPYWPCYLTSLILSILWNFYWNKRMTFKSDAFVPVAMTKVFAFYLVFTPVTTIGGNYLVEVLVWNEYLVTFINMALNLILEYLYDRYWVYKDSIDTK